VRHSIVRRNERDGSNATHSRCPRDFRLAPRLQTYRCVALNDAEGNRRHHNDLFNDLIGHRENLRWQIEAERFRGFKIDHQLELGCLHHW
jgi:hypothetical protein